MEDGGSSGRSMGAGEERVQAERATHPVCAGRGHRLPAGLLPQREATLRAGQLVVITNPHSTSQYPNKSPNLPYPPFESSYVAYCLSLNAKTDTKAESPNAGDYPLPWSLHQCLCLHSMCCTITLSQ